MVEIVYNNKGKSITDVRTKLQKEEYGYVDEDYTWIQKNA